MTNDYRFIGRIPAKWADKIAGSDTYIKRNDPRIADVKELIKIWKHNGNPDLILVKY